MGRRGGGGRVACVIMAGGASRRFGADKLTASIGGTPVIARVAQSALSVTKELYFSVGRRPVARKWVEEIGKLGELVPDSEKLGSGGPPLGICSCLEQLGEQYVLFLPGDIPWVGSGALNKLVSTCKDSRCEVGTVYWPNGRTENLIQFHKRRKMLEVALELDRLRGKLMRASDLLRGAAKTLYLDATALTDDPLCFSNVNTPADLLHPTARGPLQGGRGSLAVDGEVKGWFWGGARSEASGEYQQAADSFGREADHYEDLGLGQIAEHSRADQERSLRQASRESSYS